MLTPVIMAAHFMAITMTLEVIRAPWRLLQEVHRLTAGRIARAMLGPVFGMAWRHIHVDRCTRYIDSRGRAHRGVHVCLRVGRTGHHGSGQAKACQQTAAVTGN